ncbi:MAG TPA: polysaccharide deacetylase family protein [Methylophilaceae bacterium]|nr:polysaccharide deacetylase family protein [Methylophilaceae bacterium]
MNPSNLKPWRPPVLVYVTIALHVLALVVLLVYPQQWLWPLVGVLTNHVVLIVTGLWPRSHWLGNNWTRLPDTATQRNEVALTIDDGPDLDVTPQVLQLLDQYDAKATFFCIGSKAQQYPELCQEIVRRGHAVENHTQRHRHNFSMLGPRSMVREIQTAQIVLEGVTGQLPQFFRSPAGLRNMFLDYALNQLNLQLASWSVRGFDTRSGDAAKVKTRLLGGLRAGAILLLHDGHAARTVSGKPVIIEVLPAILESAKASGLRFVTLRNAAL